MTTQEALMVSVSIDRDWRAVYAFAHLPENLSRWASGLASGIERAGDEWIADGPGGRVRLRFAPPNDYGVLDHVVVTEAGERIDAPLRVVANGTGAEVTFTLFRRPGMTPETLAADAAWVRRDLSALKALLESEAPPASPPGSVDRSGNDRRIDYVELTVSDIARSRTFYGAAFGWSFTDYGPAYCEFADGRLTGGFAQGEPDPDGGRPLVVLYASDLAAAQRRLENAGARIVKPAFAFPGGHRLHFRDPDGYQLAVWSDR